MRGDQWTMDLGIAPQSVLDRIASAINRRPKRMFGILKTENEYVGVVRDEKFEIWERRQRAVRLRGRVQGRTGGTRVELRFVLPLRTRILVALFFGLYFVVAFGIAAQPPETILSAEEMLIAIAGAAVLALIFVAAAGRQRQDLRAFVESLFTDVPCI
ncbi:MAG: hypothetical protein E6J15_04750 [Chloroflexi bacterium]|nr:MAG: hypothetical protein E6J15_04750 [Chloroflexota bacterium]